MTHQARGPRYIVQSDVEPRNIRMDAEGNLWGEVPVLLIQGPIRSDRRTHMWSPQERSFLPARFVHEVPDDLPGAGLKPDPVEAATVAEFVDMMNRYRRWAGNPSFREMAERVGVRSPSRFCEALKSDKLPTFSLLNAFVVSLKGDHAYFQRWAAAWRALDEQASAETRPLSLSTGEDVE